MQQLPTEVYVAIVTGIFGAVGILITGIFQVVSAYKKRKSESAEEAEKALQEANKKLEKQEQEKRDTEIQRQIESIERTGQSTQNDIKMLAAQVEKMRTHVNMRASESEEGIRMITAILSKDARTRSNLIHMYARTEAQLKTLMEIETYNLRFTKETAATLSTVGELLSKLLSSSEDTQRLRKALDDSSETQQEFIDGVINAQKQFFEQSHENYDNKDLEAEIERINNIGSSPRKRRGDGHQPPNFDDVIL